MVKRRQRPRGSTPKQNKSSLSEAKARLKYFEKYIVYLEGMADYIQINHKYEKDDHRQVGWGIGRQIVAQYLVEMLLRVDLERQGITIGTKTHNLAHLFRKLPHGRRNSVETVYKLILNSEVEEAWNV